MPAVSGILGGVSGIASSIIGGNAATKASNSIGAGDLAGAQIINQNAGTAESNIANATGAAQTGVGGAVASGQQQVAGATQQGQAANSLATQQAQGTVAGGVTGANGILGGVYNGLSANLQPYLAAGTQGAQQLTQATAPGGSLAGNFSFDPTQIANNPDYQFQLQQGLQAVNQAQAASGQLSGGGTLKALTQYSQGLASNEIGQAYNQALSTYQTNRSNTLSNINTLLSTGQFGTSSLQQAAQNYGNQASANTLNGATYIGNTGISGAQYGSNLGVSGAQYNSNLGVSGANTIGNFGVQGANAGNQILGSQATQDTALLQNKANATASSNLANGYSLAGIVNGGLSLGNVLGNVSGLFGGGGSGGFQTGTASNPYGTLNGQPINPGPSQGWGIGGPVQVI